MGNGQSGDPPAKGHSAQPNAGKKRQHKTLEDRRRNQESTARKKNSQQHKKKMQPVVLAEPSPVDKEKERDATENSEPTKEDATKIAPEKAGKIKAEKVVYIRNWVDRMNSKDLRDPQYCAVNGFD